MKQTDSSLVTVVILFSDQFDKNFLPFGIVFNFLRIYVIKTVKGSQNQGAKTQKSGFTRAVYFFRQIRICFARTVYFLRQIEARVTSCFYYLAIGLKGLCLWPSYRFLKFEFLKHAILTSFLFNFFPCSFSGKLTNSDRLLVYSVAVQSSRARLRV